MNFTIELIQLLITLRKNNEIRSWSYDIKKNSFQKRI